MGEPGRPLIEEPLYEGDQVVCVRDVVSDAIVDIYVNNIFANSVQATDSKIEVNLPKTLSLQDRLAQGDPMEIFLKDGHVYEIVLVDVHAISWVNDPLVIACRRQEFTALGSNNGPLLPVTVA